LPSTRWQWLSLAEMSAGFFIFKDLQMAYMINVICITYDSGNKGIIFFYFFIFFLPFFSTKNTNY